MVIPAVKEFDGHKTYWPASSTVKVYELIETVAPVEMATEERLILHPLVPTVPSQAEAPPEVYVLNQVAVEVATAVPLVMGLAVATPATALPNAVALKLSVTSRTCVDGAVLAFAGCVPSKIFKVPPLTSAAIGLHPAL